MYTIKRTNSDNLDFQKLVIELDKDLAIKNGEANDFFAVVGVPKSLHRVMLKLFLLLFANFLVTNNRTLSHRRIFDFNY